MPTPRFLAFWSLNCPLEPSRLRGQLGAFRAAGLDGVVFHPRFYPDDPPYLGPEYCARISELILHARDLGLACWLYDENGWPSGAVGGRMLREHPEVRQQWAELVETEPADCLAAFAGDDGRRWFVARRLGPGVDYLNPALADRFLALTHERYRAGLDPAAFAHVEAFFCDEPEFGLGHVHHELSPHGAIPWTPDLPARFRERHGGDLLALLPGLFLGGEGSAGARVKFWELLRDRFCDGFLAPLDAWCRQHGKRHAAHIKGEEHPLFQAPMVGSGHAVFRHLSLPGVDGLERLPGNDYFPRQLASAAAQFGDGRCMAEAFGGAGWGATPEDLERYLLWLGGHGVTDFVLHLAQARLDSAAIRDWPPSQSLHLNWAGAYPEVLRRVRVALAGRSPAADTPGLLVVSPHRGIMETFAPWELLQTNIHNAATYPDTPAGRLNDGFLALVADLNAQNVPHHFADEATLEMGAVEAGALRVGHSTTKCSWPRAWR